MAVGEAILGAFFQVVFEKMLSPGVNLFVKLWGGVDLPKTLKNWKTELTLMEMLLTDAEQKQYSNKAVKEWVEELQDLSYDMDDLLDEFATEALRHKIKAEDNDIEAQVNASDQPGILNKVQSIYRRAAEAISTKHNADNQDTQSRIDDITQRLEYLKARIQYLGLSGAHITQHTQQTHPTEPHRSTRESTSLLCEPEVYGRDVRKSEIIGRLLNDEPNYDNFVVIPVVGQGGIGKTTLAQYVYNDDQVNSHFDLKVWVCVSDVFDVHRITTTIINSATHQEAGNFADFNQAQEKLKQVVASKKFIIVLDDVWSDKYDDWNQLQIPFKHGAKGSRVVVTTRHEKTAKMMIKNPTHSTIITLEGLSDNECWLLFVQHAKEDAELVKMRDDIIGKCKGLPLAAKALGGLLRAVEKSQRQRILDSDIWREESSILPVLRLSYHHLPPHLKRIFAYGAMFPKDVQFSKEKMVLSWMAEGFLPEKKQQEMEDIGHDYFLDLVSRSLYHEVATWSHPKHERIFVMHDLIHDVARWAAGDICAVMENMDMKSVPERTRHLYVKVNFAYETSTGELMGLLERHPFRTLLHLTPPHSDLIRRVRYLRVLVLSRGFEVLPECIGDLKHLRLLDLSSNIYFTALPESTGNLCNLQTLWLDGCIRLKNLPANTRFLINLRHLRTRGTALKNMPSGIGKLTNLQGLDKFILGDECMLRELRNLNCLHELFINKIKHYTRVEDAEEAKLHKKKDLERLSLHWESESPDEVDDNTKRDVLEKLQPHISIKECYIDGYRGLTFPAWLGRPCFEEMAEIRLDNCNRCEFLPPLGQLPLLKNLWVKGMGGIKQVGLEFYGSCSNPFPSLRALYFERMKSWERWEHSPVDENKAFPRLEKLSIIYCNSLQGNIPPQLPSLETLNIKDCKEMSVSLPSLPSLKELVVHRCKKLFTIEGVISEDYVWNFMESCCLEKLSVKACGTIVAISQIPLTLQSLEIEDCEKLRVVEFKELPVTNVSSSEEARGGNEVEVSVEGVGLTPKAPCQLLGLTSLSIARCPNLTSLQEGLLLPNLRLLTLNYCANMEVLPGVMYNFTSRCAKIQCFPEWGLPKNLTTLVIEEVNIKQPIQEWGLHLLTSLKYLRMRNIGSSTETLEYIGLSNIDGDLSLPSSLSRLSISGFQNLKSISGHITLPNLDHLHVGFCPKLESVVGKIRSIHCDHCPKLH